MFLLQSEILGDGLLSKMAEHGIAFVIMAFMIWYFMNELKKKDEKNDKVNEKIVELVEKQINSNNEMVRLYEKGFSNVENKIEIVNQKVK